MKKKLTPLNDNKLTAVERLTMYYILRGHYRCKYIPRERLAKDLNISPSSATNSLRALAEKGYILYHLISGHRYRLICVNNWTFNRYEIDEIKENKITKDEFFNSYCETQRIEFKSSGKIIPNLQDLFNKAINS